MEFVLADTDAQFRGRMLVVLSELLVQARQAVEEAERSARQYQQKIVCLEHDVLAISAARQCLTAVEKLLRTRVAYRDRLTNELQAVLESMRRTGALNAEGPAWFGLSGKASVSVLSTRAEDDREPRTRGD
jgi:hypothetical protein